MSLPSQTIDRIFARLLVRYGAAWLRMWPEGLDEALIKADWANELGNASNAAILHALDNLPTDRPPTVGQFRALCIGKPEIFKALDAPRADDAVVAAVMGKVFKREAGPKDWAHRLKTREEEGDRLTQAQRSMWREALYSKPKDSEAA